MADQDKRPSDRTTEHEDQRPGTPPRPATEPAGGGVGHRTSKTQTDPSTGEDRHGAKGSEKVDV